MRVSVFGLGYVGSVSCACLAELGHVVVGVDVARAKVDAINAGLSPVSEPELREIIGRSVAGGALRATVDPVEAVAESELALLCVGTPSGSRGEMDDTQIRRVVQELSAALAETSKDKYYVLNRSTCLPRLHRDLERVLGDASLTDVKYVAHPEFLREGTAIADFMNPPLMLFGSGWSAGQELGGELYPGFNSPTIDLSLEEAALTKYACNLFHAVKVTFANEVGELGRLIGVDAYRVMAALCQDNVLNISTAYLRPGPPFGGSCLPKDVAAIVHASRSLGQRAPLLNAILESNEAQIEALCSRILEGGFQRVAVLGLAFKEGIDDVRNSPAVELARMLIDNGVLVSAWDPCLGLEEITGVNREYLVNKIPNIGEVLYGSAEAAILGTDAIVVSQRINIDLLENLPFTSAQTLFDLVGYIDPHRLSVRYEGLYRRGDLMRTSEATTRSRDRRPP